MGTTRMYLSWRMNKQNVAHPENGIIVTRRRIDTCNNTNESQIYMLSKRSQTLKAADYVIPFT